MSEYVKGSQVRCSGAFTNAAGAAQDPTNVFFKQKDPEGTVTTYEYGTDSELVKDSTGNYHVDVDADQAGIWYYRFEATGTGKGADEQTFTVARSQFA
jgi:hypothetical protein